MSERDARAAHEDPYGHHRLACNQLNVVEPDATAPVEIPGKLPAERDEFGKAFPDRTAGRHARDRVLAESSFDNCVGGQYIDQLDLRRARLRDGAADPGRKPERRRAAQNHVVRYPKQAADFYGGHADGADTVVEGEQNLGRYYAAVLTIPAAPGADFDAVPA